MPVHEDSSIVLDSTLSTGSSTGSPKTPSVLKRPVRIYGRSRPRDTSGDGPDGSDLSSSKSLCLHGSIYKTGPRDNNEEIPPSSDPAFPNSDMSTFVDTEDENVDLDASPKYKFAWQRKLKELDEQEDFGDAVKDDAFWTRVELGGIALSRHDNRDNELSDSIGTGNNEDALTTDVLTGLAEAARTAFPYHSSTHKPPSPTPSPQPVIHHRRSKRFDHNSEHQETKSEGSFPTSPPSPQAAITTPKLYSSPTPPTSDDDRSLHTVHDTKGKGKAKDSVSPKVLPLQLFEGSNDIQARRAASKNTRGKKQKIKAPTKKELAETAKDRIRIAAEQPVLIPRTEDAKYTVRNLLVSVVSNGQLESDIDPIVDFSSDPTACFQDQNVAPSSTLQLPPKHVPKGPSVVFKSSVASDKDSEDIALPEIGELIEQDIEKSRSHKQYQGLREAKKRLLATAVLNHGDEVDDLEIVPVSGMELSMKEEDIKRKYGRKKQTSEGRKRQLKLGGVGLTKQKSRLVDAKVYHRAADHLHLGQKDGTPLTQSELNTIMATRAEDERQKITLHKEEEWKRRGGKVKNGDNDLVASVQEVIKAYVKKGLTLPQRSLRVIDADLDESDEDWTSKESVEGDSAFQLTATGDEECHESSEDEGREEDVTMVNEEDSGVATGDDDMEEPIGVRLPVRHRSTRKPVVDSDSEAENENKNKNESATKIPQARLCSYLKPFDNVEGCSTPSHPSILSHRGSISSMDGRTEDSDEGDKENKTSRMWDRGEDKENTATVRHTPPSTKTPTTDAGGRPNDQPITPVLCNYHVDSANDTVDDESRRPFKDLLDQDPFTSPSRSKLSNSFETRLRQLSSMTSSSAALVPFLDAKSSDNPQFSDVGTKRNSPTPLETSFSDLFDHSTAMQRATPPKHLWENVSMALIGMPKRASLTDDLELTQDVDLQPAFQVSGNLLRRADAIFEKEQEYALEAARKSSGEPELYINDHGFLTQTRPNVTSPEVYKPLPSTLTATSNRPSELQPSQRRPLRTLSLSDGPDLESPTKLGLSRLRKREMVPTLPLLQPSHQPRPLLSQLSPERSTNAFDVMKQAAKPIRNMPMRRLEKSDFIEQEAEESDDDEMLGFGLKTHDSKEEEDGEDLDETLKTLVDDQEMDEKTIAAQLVLEKFKEQEQADDQEIEKLHQAAVQGELRKKRRNRGVGMDDSDGDSDEDEANHKIRRSMHKKQKIDRDNIRELGENAETKSFFSVYENDLIVDSSDFSHLHDSQVHDTLMANKDDDDDDNDEVHQVITRTELVRQAREVAQQSRNADDEPLDPDDVSWVDENLSNDDDEPRVKPATVKTQNRVIGQRRRTDQTEFDMDSEMPSSRPIAPEGSLRRMQTWAGIERRSRGEGTGRNMKTTAVTHKVKPQVGFPKTLALRPSAKEQRTAKSHPSVLATVAAERQTTRFG